MAYYAIGANNHNNATVKIAQQVPAYVSDFTKRATKHNRFRVPNEYTTSNQQGNMPFLPQTKVNKANIVFDSQKKKFKPYYNAATQQQQ